MDAAKCFSLFNGKTKKLQPIQLKPFSISISGSELFIRLLYQTPRCSFLCRYSLADGYK
ncbi:Uncharacterised protein [Vibrio owensii]|nr:Uncharacterised protein [Vibrio owensii]